MQLDDDAFGDELDGLDGIDGGIEGFAHHEPGGVDPGFLGHHLEPDHDGFGDHHGSSHGLDDGHAEHVHHGEHGDHVDHGVGHEAGGDHLAGGHLAGGHLAADHPAADLSLAGDPGDLPHWDGEGAVIGDPASALDHWHEQEQADTCAVASQELVLESVTGHDFDEGDLAAEAEANGWYTPGGGTPLWATGNLLEAHGVDAQQWSGATMDDLAAAVAGGHPVIVGVDADELWSPGSSADDDGPLGDSMGIPGQDANHAVTVIGFDVSDPDHPMVIVNDPGHPDGQGYEVPVDEFADAWQDSDHFMVTTAPAPVAADPAMAAVPGPMSAPMPAMTCTPIVCGYYNADGTYHWTTTNQDTDPATGAVVRRW